MADFLQGFLGTQQAGVEARNDVTVAIRNWFANRNPLVTRLPYVPVERVDFRCTRTNTGRGPPCSATAVSSATQATLTVGGRHVPDEPRRAGDRGLGDRQRRAGPDQRRPDQLDHRQRHPRALVARSAALSGTTPLSSAATGSTVNLIGNSRTGAEVNQTGLTTVGVPRTQYCQTFQFPVQIGGVGPDGAGPGAAGRHPDAVRLQHDRPAPEHGGRHRELRLLRHRPGAQRLRPASRPR